MRIIRTFRQPTTKFFGKVNDKTSYILREDVLERTFIEILKLMELYQMGDGRYISHWAGKPLEGIREASKYYSSPQETISLAIVKNFNELNLVFGANGVKILKNKYGTPDKFIDHIRKRLLTESPANNEEPKYNSWFSTHQIIVDNKNFARFIKTFALCLSGQLDANIAKESYWEKDTSLFVNKTQVNYKVNNFRSLSKKDFIAGLKRILLYVLSGYTMVDFTDKI